MGEKEKMGDFLAEFQKHYQKMQEELEAYEALQKKYRKVQEENQNLRKKYDGLYRRSKALVQELETVMEDPETEEAAEPAEEEPSEPSWKRQLEEVDAEAEDWLDEEPEAEEDAQSEAEKIRQRALAEAEAAEQAAKEALEQAERQETSESEAEPEAEPKTETKAEPEPEQPKKKKKNKAVSIILDVLFYALLVALVAGAALFARQNQAQKNDGGIFGYSYYQVLTTSMQSEIPQGSLVLVHQGTDDIQVGDDITFMVSETDVATHRCIEIEDNYNGSGMRAFNTQGVDNPHPDGFTMENNVIGKVVFHVPYLGKILALIADNLVWFVIGMVSVMVLISALRTLLEEAWKERKAKNYRHRRKTKWRKRT